MKPFLKWVGGKTQLLPELMSRLPSKMRAYHEPFLGGGALALALTASGRFPVGSSLADANTRLIDAYRIVRDYPNQLNAVLRLYANTEDSAENYCQQRLLFNQVYPESVTYQIGQAGRFIYLNKACFNGLYRENSKGKMNSPWGHRPKVALPESKHILEASKLLQGCRLRSGDFRDTFAIAQCGDFVYCDPPYAPVNSTSFTKYQAKDFGQGDQEDLAQLAREAGTRGVCVMLSNADTPFIREIYTGFRIESVQARRSVNSDGAGRGKFGEVILRNY